MVCNKNIQPGAFERALKTAEQDIIRLELIKKDEKVLCALSGGADSVAMLIILRELSEKIGFSLYAAHLNHGIRGGEADADESFCKELCTRLGIGLTCERVDVPSEAQSRGMGLEECAREVRYGFLRRTAECLGCNSIATAHHADDNVETMLFHMIRGCGIKGLGGILPKRDGIIRPLLSLRKEEILAALEEIGQTYVYDSTNASDDYTRNYIRHNILPHIYALNGSADKAFARLGRSALEDEAYFLSKAREVSVHADRATLADLDTPVLARYIRLRYESEIGSLQLDHGSVRRITDAIKGADGTSRLDLPGGAVAYVNSRGLQLEARNDLCAEPYEIPLKEGENELPGYGYKILITDDKKVAQEWKNIYKLSTLWTVAFDKISNGGLIARSRRAGDSYTFGKMKRDVRRQMIRFKLPVQKRDTAPCICDENGMIAVYGLPVADGMIPKNGEKKAYIVCAEINN